MAIPFDDVRCWLFDDALPYWADIGVDRSVGGFNEELDMAGRDAGASFKRTRVLARQLYVFSHAASLGWSPGEKVAADGFEFLMRSAKRAERGGWARSVTRAGEISDPSLNLYDHAFVLFALSWYYRVSGDRRALENMSETLGFIQSHMRCGLGFAHELPIRGHRLQNPHMHLLEACIAAFEASADERYVAQAAELVSLFKTYFFDGLTLAEYFDNDWARADGEAGRIVEPGHQFEWAWILARYGALFSSDQSETITTLVSFAERYGVDTNTKLTYNAIDVDGKVQDGGSRVWPNSERIKGNLALFEVTGAETRSRVADACNALLKYHLNRSPRGIWTERMDIGGRALQGNVPASTLYHLFLAFAELLRLEQKLAS